MQQFCVQASSETVIKTLVKNYPKELLPLVYRFASYIASNPINDYTNMKMILERDAIYTTIGLVAYELYDEYMKFSELLNFMSMEIAQSQLNMNINSNGNGNLGNSVIKKRVAWVVYMWSSVLTRSDEKLYKNIYTLLLHLMEPVCILYTYIYSFIRTHIHNTYIMHTCIDTYIQTNKYSYIQTYRCMYIYIYVSNATKYTYTIVFI